jgi:hypothetical protein
MTVRDFLGLYENIITLNFLIWNEQEIKFKVPVFGCSTLN